MPPSRLTLRGWCVYEYKYLVAFLFLRLVLRHVLVACLVVHDEDVVHEVEAVRSRLEWVGNHLLNLCIYAQTQTQPHAHTHDTNTLG